MTPPAPPRPPPRPVMDLRERLEFALRRVRGVLARTGASVQRRGLRGTLVRAAQELRPGRRGGRLHLLQPAAAPFRPFAVPCDDAPLASIVIPVHDHFPHTLACLRALASCAAATPFEIILVDDASRDETSLRVRGIEGLRVVTLAVNAGFIAACNAGARVASGDFLVFLNNDTVVQPGWLDALIGTFAEHPSAGLVGARLVYPDGRLQEAGAIVFADGSGWNCGRFEDPQAPAWSFVREVDYCSGAAIAIARELFVQLEGFDPHYTPAYYEDTDLAMKVRAFGLRVLYQPAALVLHHEGVSSGTDVALGTKAYQPVNRRKFRTRWAETLASHPRPGTDIRVASAHRARQRVLVLDACTPRPDHDSGSLRMFNLLTLLREEDCAVTFIAANRSDDGPYTHALQQAGVQVWCKPWIGSFSAWFKRHGWLFDTVIASRHEVAADILPLVRRHAPRARFVFDTVDLHFLRESREAELTGNPALARKAQRTRASELGLARRADLSLVVSPFEQELLEREAPGARVEVLSNLLRMPAERPGYDARRDLVFVGSFRHPPNVDAALWLVREILPCIRAHRDDLLLHLIGPWPPPAVLALAERPGVRVHGHVPDLDEFMDGCRIALAPLRFGAGIKGKINRSMAHGQPVVATPVAIEGMQLRVGHEVLLGEDADSFATQVLRLYDDRALWQQLAGNGVAHVERHFSFTAAREALRRVLAGPAAEAHGHAPLSPGACGSAGSPDSSSAR